MGLLRNRNEGGGEAIGKPSNSALKSNLMPEINFMTWGSSGTFIKGLFDKRKGSKHIGKRTALRKWSRGARGVPKNQTKILSRR